MKIHTEIVIIPNSQKPNPNTIGQIFEDLITSILAQQRYKITQRINFTGMEIDLLCSHLDRENEIALVECKARSNLNSPDIKSFVFNVNHRKVNYGYFVSTCRFQHQVAGLIEEMKRLCPSDS